MRPTTEEILMTASTQEAAKADKPALRAKPTTCTRGIEWQRQQKMLINESDQKRSMRRGAGLHQDRFGIPAIGGQAHLVRMITNEETAYGQAHGHQGTEDHIS